MHRNIIIIGINIFICLLECKQARSAITLEDLSNITILTADNFDEELERNDLFALFYDLQ